MGYKILVVDDDKDVVETIQNRLRKEGYEVAIAYDGEEAISKVGSEDPDVILLDLVMPKLNGFEVLKSVREGHADKWRPVIIISAQVDLEALKKAYHMEADHYLTKPCTMENILRGISTMISLISIREK